MQDRFKFRVWDKKDKELIDNPKIKVNVNGETINEIFSMLSDRYEFLQCTGLKDKNGQLIYVGDILLDVSKKAISFNSNKVKKIYEVVHMRNGYYAISREYKAPFNLYNIRSNIEIIGNVKEDKELLEG